MMALHKLTTVLLLITLIFSAFCDKTKVISKEDNSLPSKGATNVRTADESKSKTTSTDNNAVTLKPGDNKRVFGSARLQGKRAPNWIIKILESGSEERSNTGTADVGQRRKKRYAESSSRYLLYDKLCMYYGSRCRYLSSTAALPDTRYWWPDASKRAFGAYRITGKRYGGMGIGGKRDGQPAWYNRWIKTLEQREVPDTTTAINGIAIVDLAFSNIPEYNNAETDADMLKRVFGASRVL